MNHIGSYRYTYALNNPLKYTDPSGYQTYLSPGYMAYSNHMDEPEYKPDRFDFPDWLRPTRGGGSGGSYNNCGSSGNHAYTLDEVLELTNPHIYRPSYYDPELGKWIHYDEKTRRYYYNDSSPYWGNSFVKVKADMKAYVKYVRDFGVQSTRVYLDATSDGAHYLEGSYSFDKTFVHYMPNVGLLGSWSNVRGSVNVYRGKDGKYYARVSATGYTPASLKGTTTYSGGVDVIVGSTVVNSYSLSPSSGPTLMRGGRQDVGNATFLLPDASGDVFVRFNVGYTYSEGTGVDVPYPTQGHYKIQIGFTIDGWTY